MADVAQGKTATASSSYSGYPASNAVDGNDATAWSPASSGLPIWLQVDLGTDHDIDSFRLLFSSGTVRFTNYVIEHSADASTWTQVYTITGNASGDTGTVMFPGGEATARYWRAYATAANSWSEVATFQLFGDESTPGTADTAELWFKVGLANTAWVKLTP
jgi:hypothetical protein